MSRLGAPRSFCGYVFRAERLALGLPRLFAFLLIIVEGFDQPGEHFRRSLEKRLSLRLRDFSNICAQMIDKLTHLSFDFLRVVNGVILGSHNCS